MTREDLHDLIAQGEGPALEFKQSQTKDLGRELCAFANSDGGTLLIGITDRGRIVGAADHNRVKSRIQSVARSADPPIDIEIDAIDEVLRVTVSTQPHKPYSFGGRFFRRDGATSQQMARAEIEDLFYAAGRLHFDRTPCPDFDLACYLNDETWARFSQPAKIPETMNRVTALLHLGLIDAQQRMTHAGAWLMVPDIRSITTSAHISCALFLGRTKSRILDRREFHSPVATMIDDVTAWILTKINVELIIKTVRREERPELPEDALREAVANAVAHRDYRSPGNVQVYVFKDRVEIVSPGGLPAGMTQADLGAKSMPRNPLLFSMLYRMDVVEHIGSGIRRILDRCQEHSVPRPTIEVSENWVTVTFHRPERGDDRQDCRPEEEPETKPEPSEARGLGKIRPESATPRPESKTDDDLGRIGRRSSEGSLDQRVLALLVDGPMSKSAIARRLGHRSVSGGLNRVVRRLRHDGLVEYTLPEKPNSSRQKYKITPPGLLSLEA